MQVALTNLQRFEPPRWVAVRFAIHLLAVGAVGFGAGAVMASRLGQGTGELLALAASDRSGRPEQRMRLMFEASFLAVGGLLGGPIGLGTVLIALCIGPSVARPVALWRPGSQRPAARSALCIGRCHADRAPRGTVRRVKVHLVDGTYELFRQHFGSMNRRGDSPREPGPFEATTGVLSSTLQLLEEGATHIGVASDHVIESFRNDLWPGYKTSEGMPPELLTQIPIMEGALEAMGVTTWAMVEWEADDALGAAAALADADERVEQVMIVTPDKDLGQCVKGKRVVQFDRRKREVIDEEAVVAKFGVGRSRSPTTSGLLATPPTGFQGCPAGARSRQRWCSRGTAITRTSPTRPASGRCPDCAAPPSSRPRSRRTWSWRFSSASSPPSTATRRSGRLTTGNGRDRPTSSRGYARSSAALGSRPRQSTGCVTLLTASLSFR